ncbi:hypothetical protein HN51_056384 [Arachis hypogaea]|uniref:Exocyst subunit Exo70 family protein n=1 Tax=Arachis hypogaea TaxID=3818 RepID=A0A6B9VFS6_ARAHY|nr:exocyst complex component EXO70B1-like [Arachis ipaensis]XP_025679137.1 exocyst complex component EXO70B1-like [Arachis hypogaea]QHN79222.1 Exocyst complex component [Arachis hypogaea]
MEKSFSFSSYHFSAASQKQRDKDLESSSSTRGGPQWKSAGGEEELAAFFQDHDTILQVSEEVDGFLETSATTPPLLQVPDCVHRLTKILDSMVYRYNTGKSKLGKDAEDDDLFLAVVDRISKISAILSTFPCDPSVLDKTTFSLEKAMSFLEKHLCTILQDPKSSTTTTTPTSSYHGSFRSGSGSESKPKPPKKSSSFGSLTQVHDAALCSPFDLVNLSDPPIIPTLSSHQDQDQDTTFPAFSPEKVSLMNKIASAMIAAGYQTECCVAFASFRRIAFKTALQEFGYVSVGMEEIHKMQWEMLEGEIATWNNAVRHCITVLFNGEKKLYASVFPNQQSISQNLLSDLARAVIIHFLNFAQGVVLTLLTVEKLFKFLDMYETLRDVVEIAIADGSYLERCRKELAHEIATTKLRIAEATMAMFRDLENSVKGDNDRVPVPNGAIHPLTRYVMNYLEYACEYKDTLEQVLRQCLQDDYHTCRYYSPIRKIELEEDDGTPKNSALAIQLMTIMDLLSLNLEYKAMLYKDFALRSVFLMNNGRYIVQKVKGCKDLHLCMGDNWCRKRQSGLKLHHKNYRTETWSKVLNCLSTDGLQGNTSSVLSPRANKDKKPKQELKDKFKRFNSTFEDIYKTQSSWVVSDEQLKSELRASIAALVIPAYRSFYGRFKHHLNSSRHVDKYIKYHPEDIEAIIEELFDGGTTKRKS